MKQQRADLAMNVAILCLGASLIFSGFALLRLRQGLLGTAGRLDLPELIAVGASGCGVALLAWWLLAMICAVITAIAQARGANRVASASRTFAPAFMLRVVITVLGLNLLAAPLAHAAEAPGVDPRWHASTVATAPALPPETANPAATGTPRESLPAQIGEAVEPHWTPQTAETDPDLLLRPGSRAERNADGTASAPEEAAQNVHPSAHARWEGEDDVVVKSGDSLWSIVAAALGPYASDVDVASSWPAWYRANRETIGTDPHVIYPGQILHAPLGP